MQFGERCHWLEAERITHKYDPRWTTGVWLGRHSASDAHLIGTPGGVIQVRTVRRLTREQRNDDVSKRAFDNLLVRREIFQVQNHLWKSKQLMVRSGPLTPGCKGCIWARRGYHHTKACKARKREFLLTKARSEELRAAEADAWRKPSSATEPSSSARPSGSAREEGTQRELVDEQPQLQPDVRDSEIAVDAYCDQDFRPYSAGRGVPKRMRIWSKHSRPLTTAVMSEQPEKRAKIPTPASLNPETLAKMLESDGNLETYTELNAVAMDLHEPEPETMWSSDLEWVPKSILHEAREKEVKKLQQFENVRRSPTGCS